MIGQRVTFDGHVLNDLFYVGMVEAEPPAIDVDLRTLDGKDGTAVNGTRLAESAITVPLVVRPGTALTTRQALSFLMGWLDVDGPRTLTLSDDGGLERVAVPSGVTIDDYEYNDRLTVTFTQVEPCLYGGSSTFAVPSGGSATFEVTGNYVTMPVITAQAAQRDASTEMWSLTFDEGDYVRLKLPTALATTVSIDCKERRVLVGGEVSMLTLESDWPRLAAGTHTVRMDLGTGAATISIRERCL